MSSVNGHAWPGAAGAPITPARPIRVMHLVYTLRPGGMEHGVVKVVNGLDPARVVSSICSTTPANSEMCATVRADIPVIELNRREGNDPALVWAIYRVLKRERPDILHTHAWGTLIEGIVAGRMARIPTIVHGEHGTLQLRPRQVRAQRWGWRHADQLLSVSSRLAERMSQAVGIPRDRVCVIRNGVNLARFNPSPSASARAALGVSDHRTLVVGAVGRLVDVKDHATFIDALAALRSRGRPVQAVIAGDGALRDELQARIGRLGLGSTVRLLGHRPGIEAVLGGLDIFVQPSKSEGMSNTILEAMACGRPVIATNVGGADEMVIDGETGILIPPSNSSALADALDRLGDRPELRNQMGSAGRARAYSEFSLEHMIESYQTFYCGLMSRRSALASHARACKELV